MFNYEKTFSLWIVEYGFRFDDVAELLWVPFFDVGGEFDCRVLSIDTAPRILILKTCSLSSSVSNLFVLAVACNNFINS